MKNKTKTRSGVADLQKEDGSRIASSREKAEVLNSLSKSDFTVEGEDKLPNRPQYEFLEELGNFYITVEKVRKALANLETGKYSGD